MRLADEPTGNLDSQNGQHILDLLISINRQDRRIVLRDGLVLSDEV